MSSLPMSSSPMSSPPMSVDEFIATLTNTYRYEGSINVDNMKQLVSRMFELSRIAHLQTVGLEMYLRLEQTKDARFVGKIVPDIMGIILVFDMYSQQTGELWKTICIVYYDRKVRTLSVKNT